MRNERLQFGSVRFGDDDTLRLTLLLQYGNELSEEQLARCGRFGKTNHQQLRGSGVRHRTRSRGATRGLELDDPLIRTIGEGSDAEAPEHIAGPRKMFYRSWTTLYRQVLTDKQIGKGRVIQVFGRLEDRKAAIKMMDRKLDVVVFERGKSAYPLNITQNKKVGRRIAFLDHLQRIFTLVRASLGEIALREHEARHVGVVLVTDLTTELDRFPCSDDRFLDRTLGQITACEIAFCLSLVPFPFPLTRECDCLLEVILGIFQFAT